MEILQDLKYGITLAELSIAAKESGASSNELGILKNEEIPDDLKNTFLTQFKVIPERSRRVFNKYLKVVSEPEIKIMTHTTFGLSSISRIIALKNKNIFENYVELQKTSNQYEFHESTQNVLKFKAIGSLARGLKPKSNIALKLSTGGLICYLGCLEAFRQNQLASLLNHEAPDPFIPHQKIVENLRRSEAIDLRWPLSLYMSVFPINMANTLTDEEIEEGLNELTSAELLEKASESLYDLTPQGQWLMTEMASQCENMLAISKTALVNKNKVFDFFLFFKCQNDIFFIKQSGLESVILSITDENLEEIMDGIFD